MSVTEPHILASLQPLDRRRLHELVLTQLLIAIQSGHLKQGERLPELEIAERLSLSRGTVREAIRRLEQAGLVVSQPHRGAFITQLSPEDAREIFSLRRLLEAFAVRLAVARVTEEALSELETLTKVMVDLSERGKRIERVRIDLQFHERLCLLSGHRHLHQVWYGLALKLWLVYFDPRSRQGPDVVGRAASHFELIEHLRRGEAEEAVSWIERHIGERGERALDELSTTPVVSNTSETSEVTNAESRRD